ncbi:MAG: response regulator [Anaerolineae bacterium]|nr:response regulator [Anaerolineae bacterium]
MRSARPILLIEDDRVDAMTVRRALRDIHVTNHLVVTSDGVAALEYLRDPNNQQPCIILLDLNMPRMNGIEFLRAIRNDVHLCHLPVIVLTTSGDEQDRMNSFNLGVAGYMLKPVSYNQFVEVVRAIDFYWTLSELPPEA